MKLNNKVLMLTILSLISSAQTREAVVEKATTEAFKAKKAAAKKTLVECVTAAKCKKTLEENLRNNGHAKIADAFKNVTTKFQAMRAYMKLDATTKAQVEQVVKNHQAHFQKILGL